MTLFSEFHHVGSALDRDGEVPESSHFDLFKCPVCSAVVFRDDCLSHKTWHLRLGHMPRPAETPEDRAYAPGVAGVTRVRGRHPSEQDGPVLRVAEGPVYDPDPGSVEYTTDPEAPDHDHHDDVTDYPSSPEQEYGPPDAPISARTSERVMQMVNCAHKWPGIELTSDVECERCGLPYGQWSK